VIVVIAGVIWLSHVGRPGTSRYLRFEGYILLPQHGALNVLDYMSISGRTLFVGGTSAGSVLKVDLGARNPPASEWRDGGRVHGVAVAGSRDLAFATRSETNVVDAFRPSTLTPMHRIAVPEDPDAILYDRGHDIIYIANGDAGVGTLIDPTTSKTVATISLDGKPEFATIDSQSGLLYQNIESADALAAIDLGQRRVIGRWSLKPCQSPTGIAIDPSSRRAFVVCGKNALLVVFDLERHRIVASLAIGTGPDAVAYDPSLKRIYATGLGGRVSVTRQLSADSYRNLDLVSTHFAAHTLAVDPETHKVYVGYASLFAMPRIAVFSPASD
jgi:DNA-binding beta-propeller fold protein YncE